MAFFHVTILCAQQDSTAVVSDKLPKEYVLTLVSQSFQLTSFHSPSISVRTNRIRCRVKMLDGANQYSRLIIKSRYRSNRVKVKLKQGSGGCTDKLKYSIRNGSLNTYKLVSKSYDKLNNTKIHGTELCKLKIKFGRVEKRYLGKMKTCRVLNYDAFKERGEKYRNSFNVNLPAVDGKMLIDEDIKILWPSLKLKTQ